MSNSSTFSDGNNFDNGGSGQRENNGGGGGGDNQSAEQQRGGSGGANNDNVCRDFLNNVCFRGSRCKYFHPPDMGMATEPKKEEFRFCNDYQNRGCRRENCRYVHCARADVDDYEQTGRMSEALAKAIVAITGQDQVAGRPLCKEFLSGSCSRGNRCRFWHINPREEKELRAMESASGLGGAGGAPGAYPPPPTRGRPGGRSANVRGGGGGGQFPYAPAPASHHAIDPPYWAYDGVHGGVGVPPQEYDRYPSAGMYEPYADFNGPVRRDAKRPRLDERFANPASQQRSRSISPTAYTTVLEENAALRRKVDMLKQTIAEVTASNDTLISENARLRAKTATTAATVTDQAIVAASMASAAAINSVLSSSVAGLNPQALVPPAGSTLTPAEHLAVVSLAAAGHQQPMVVQPQALETDGVRWSFSQMNR